MASIIKYTALNPVVTGGLLYALTRAPVDIREKAIAAVSSLPYAVELTTLIRTLKCHGCVERELCVMTGGSGGLGQIATRHLIKKGVRVAILDIAPPPTELLNSSVKEIADQVKKEHGTVSILCNNAGIGRTNLITEATDANLDKIFKINLISHWYTVREFLPDMIRAKKGHIISTASMASYTTCAGMVDYCVTKAGAQAFTDGME
ncbi:hypothetical protein MRB53_041514 [Persea americana]|nr:hypothetical protein MRB53_041514 [Persea americana]